MYLPPLSFLPSLPLMARNLLLCGSMDRSAFILDLQLVEDPLVQKFTHHSKYIYLCTATYVPVEHVTWITIQLCRCGSLALSQRGRELHARMYHTVACNN